MPKLAFPLARTSFYRTLGPLLEATLEDSYWEVELVLGLPVPADNLKSYQNPTSDNVPARFKGRCKTRMVFTTEEMAAALNEADAVIANVGCSCVAYEFADRVRNPVWCAVFDADHSVLPAHHFDEAEMNFWASHYYLDWAVEVGLASREHLEARSYEIGYVRADPLKWSTREAVRREWRIDQDRPVVLYIPDGYRLSLNSAFITDWYRHVWCVESRAERLLRALLFRRNRQAVREALNGDGNDAQMIRALRAFCDSNGAGLVMMPRRQKEWSGSSAFTAEELKAADFIVSEDEAHPQTTLRAIQMADLVICGYASGALLDALAAGVPYITIGMPFAANSLENELYAQRFNREQGDRPGATWLIPAEDFIRNFPGKWLSDFKIDPVVLDQVRAQYVGPVDGQCSRRLLEAVRTRLDGQGARKEPARRMLHQDA